MFYIIYKITNIINNKIYIGKHKTADLNDGYMGSGKHLKRSIQKYGVENFTKEILFVFDNDLDMNDKETELVTEEFCLRKDTYNICVGGQGGFSYINSNNIRNGFESRPDEQKIYSTLGNNKFIELLEQETYLENFKNKVSIGVKRYYDENESHWIGRKHSEESKIKIGLKNSKKSKGNLNSQFGTVWITNGFENKKIKKDLDNIPEGWYRGRSL